MTGSTATGTTQEAHEDTAQVSRASNGDEPTSGADFGVILVQTVHNNKQEESTQPVRHLKKTTGELYYY